jgi:hypothetical protein
MKQCSPCSLTLSSIFSALPKSGKAPTKRPYFFSSSRGAKGGSFAVGGLMAIFGELSQKYQLLSQAGRQVVPVEAQSGLARGEV